jgi:hypothetical protein
MSAQATKRIIEAGALLLVSLVILVREELGKARTKPVYR